MRTQGIYINVSRRNDDLPQLIEEYSEQFNLSKADTVAEILRAYPKLLAYKHRVMEQESRSFGRLFSNSVKTSFIGIVYQRSEVGREASQLIKTSESSNRRV